MQNAECKIVVSALPTVWNNGRGAPRSESKIYMIASGNHTLIPDIRPYDILAAAGSYVILSKRWL